MRRSICYCEPHYALAGQITTWNFTYSPATTLKKGAKLKFDLLSDGRDIDWEIPEVSLKRAENVIYAYHEKEDKVIAAKEVFPAESYVPQYEFTLPADLKGGDHFIVSIGCPKGKENKSKTPKGSQCQTTVQRRRPFLLYVDPKGNDNYQDPEMFSMDIRGNELNNIRILTPSFVTKNKRFDVVIRFEDEFGNLTSNAPEGTLVELTYENQRENLNWKLFVPETGFITIPNFYFNEEGTYTIHLTNLQNKEVFYSSPIKCFADTERQLFWGLLHGESERVDSTENIESCLRHFRDERALNFFGTSSFESAEETPNDIWKLVSQNVADFNENDRFSSLLGFQWQGEGHGEGLRHFLYFKDNKPLLRKKDAKNNSLKKIYKSASPKDFISIPSFTMGNGLGFDFKNHNPDFERVVEIYNAWGSSERTEKEGNSHPIVASSKKGIKENADGAVLAALKNNHRFGFVGGGLDDRGVYSTFFESDQEQYTPGMTAIVAEEHSREALMEAIYQRSCYATTGERIIVDFHVAGIPMGQEVSTTDKPGLSVNRHISGFVAGTTPITTIEIVRNGEVIKTLKPDAISLDFTFDDMDPIDKAVIKPKDKRAPFMFYYLRIQQEDEHVAWTSPIWVDDTKKLK